MYNKYEEQKPQKTLNLQRKRQQIAKQISFSHTKQQPPSDDADLKLLGSDDKQPPSDQSEDDIGAFVQNLEKGDDPTGYSSGEGFSGSSLVGNSSVTCPGNILSDI